jgi:hypothetical protein
LLFGRGGIATPVMMGIGYRSFGKMAFLRFCSWDRLGVAFFYVAGLFEYFDTLLTLVRRTSKYMYHILEQRVDCLEM